MQTERKGCTRSLQQGESIRFFELKKRIFIPSYIAVQKLYFHFQSLVSKQTLDMPKKILSCERVC